MSDGPTTPDQDGSDPQGPTVRDRRRIDPETYEVREPQDSAAPAAPEASGSAGAPAPTDDAPAGAESDPHVTELQSALAERTADLQRLQAEYVNYKRRVDRDRDLSRRTAVEGVLRDLLPVLDDLRSAREHGELSGAFKAVGEEVERVTAKNGLESFGTKGDAFDPHIHEALLHAHAEGIDGPTCVEILQPGYRVGERVLRPARVAVAEPDPSAPAAPTETGPADSSPAGP
ncbi:MAG: grpE [Friedmanniella sp.]|nr:grpE [Friedmanniella sp.]